MPGGRGGEADPLEMAVSSLWKIIGEAEKKKRGKLSSPSKRRVLGLNSEFDTSNPKSCRGELVSTRFLRGKLASKACFP